MCDSEVMTGLCVFLPEAYLVKREDSASTYGNDGEELECLAVHPAQHDTENSWVCDQLLLDDTEQGEQVL